MSVALVCWSFEQALLTSPAQSCRNTIGQKHLDNLKRLDVFENWIVHYNFECSISVRSPICGRKCISFCTVQTWASVAAPLTQTASYCSSFHTRVTRDKLGWHQPL